MANLVPIDPFAELRALQKQFFGEDLLARLPSSTQLWPTDIYTDGDKAMVIEAHLPDFDDKDVSVSIENGVLEIQAEKHEKSEEKNRKYVVRESSRSYYRRVHLPQQSDEDKVNAKLDNGVLKVTVPFKQLPPAKKIAVAGKK